MHQMHELFKEMKVELLNFIKTIDLNR